MFVNSMGWIVELGYELLKHTVQARAFKMSPLCLHQAPPLRQHTMDSGATAAAPAVAAAAAGCRPACRWSRLHCSPVLGCNVK